MTKCLSLCAALVLSLAGIGGAQDAQVAQEQFRVQFEISKNGTVVARPVLKLETGKAGSIALTDGPTFALTPSRIDANTVRIACNVEIGNAGPLLRFDLRDQEQGSGSITVGGDSFVIRAAMAR